MGVELLVKAHSTWSCAVARLSSLASIPTDSGAKEAVRKPRFDRDGGRTWWLPSLCCRIWTGLSLLEGLRSFDVRVAIGVVSLRPARAHGGRFPIPRSSAGKHQSDDRFTGRREERHAGVPVRKLDRVQYFSGGSIVPLLHLFRPMLCYVLRPYQQRAGWWDTSGT